MVRRLLLPVDGSKHGRRAAELAGLLASTYDADVILLHVLDADRLSETRLRMAEVEHRSNRKPEEMPWMANVPSELMAMLQPADSRETREQTLHFLAEKVVKTATDVLEAHGVPAERIRVLFQDGKPARRILETVADHEVDMVVMGSRGLSDVAGLVMGSVSQRVASVAPCTVVTTR